MALRNDKCMSDIERLGDVLPPADEYAREEWVSRTWYGRLTLPVEVPLVLVLRSVLKLKRRFPQVYREVSAETKRGEDNE